MYLRSEIGSGVMWYKVPVESGHVAAAPPRPAEGHGPCARFAESLGIVCVCALASGICRCLYPL